MTYERIAVEALGRCNFAPATFDKRFARSLAGTPEDARLSPKQRALLWKLVVKYRRQMPPVAVAAALSWLNRPQQQIAFEQQLDADPADAATRLVYADWLDDHNHEELAAAQRWMAAEGIFPELIPGGLGHGPDGAYPMNFEWSLGMKAHARFHGLRVFRYWNHSREEAEVNLALCLAAQSEIPSTRMEKP